MSQFICSLIYSFTQQAFAAHLPAAPGEAVLVPGGADSFPKVVIKQRDQGPLQDSCLCATAEKDNELGGPPTGVVVDAPNQEEERGKSYLLEKTS